MRVCFISYYPNKNYPRQKQFIDILNKDETLICNIILNKKNGLLGYMDLIIRVIYTRIRQNPDKYILGFRGNEIFIPIRIITIGKELHFDSFVPLYQAFRYENKWDLKQSTISLFSPFVYLYEYLCLLLSQVIYTDTLSHKRHYISNFKIKENKLFPLYLGCTADVLSDTHKSLQSNRDDVFTIFFYGTMQPLHGIEIILNCAKELILYKNIIFKIVGGDERYILKRITENNLTNINYTPWLKFDQLMVSASKANLCVGGPLGGTTQAMNVITGKTFQFLKLSKCTIIGINNETNIFPFKHRKNCLLIKQACVKSLYNEILWCYKNINKLEIIGKNGYDLSLSFFTYHKLKTFQPPNRRN